MSALVEQKFMEAYAECQELRGQVASLQARLDAAEKDAARYRWLREQQWNTASLFVIAGSKSLVRLGTDCPSLARLDAAIDAARSAE